MLPSNYVCQGQMTIFDFLQESQFGKTFPEPSAQIMEKTSDVCLKNWQESKTPKFQYLNLKSGCQVDVSNFLVVVSHGEPTMLNIGESPNEEKESHLSWILETNPNPKYNLSPVACQGILRRATTRGKKLPELLEKVLIQQSVSKNVVENLGGVKESLSKMTTLEHCPQQTIKPLCIGNGQLHDALTPSEKCKTLNTMVDPMKVVCVGNGQLAQAELSEKVGALNCMHDQQAVIVLEGNGSRPSHNGDGFNESDVSYTLNAVEHHAVCVGVDAYNQTTTGDKSKSLNSAATDSDHVPCVCYGLDRASFNQGKNAKFDISIQEDIAQPIVARGPGGGNADKVNALCARDFKGVGNQYVAEGKCIIQPYNGNDSKN